MLKTLHNKFIDLIREERKESESLLFQDYKNGLITSLELAQQILKLHSEELESLKKLNDVCNS